MTAERLLRLYPRGWRERYGAEFLDLLGGGPLRLAQIIDIVSGALDAHLSSDVRASTSRRQTAGSQGGTVMLDVMKRTCAHSESFPFTLRDSWIGAGVIVAASIALSVLGIVLNQQGLRTLGEAVKSVSFPVAVLSSLPFTWMKGQPWKAQVVVVGGTLVLVALITFGATRL